MKSAGEVVGGGGIEVNRRWNEKIEKDEKMNKIFKKMEEIWGNSGGFLGYFPHADMYMKNKLHENEEKEEERNKIINYENDDDEDDIDDNVDSQLEMFHGIWLNNECNKIENEENQINAAWAWLSQSENTCNKLVEDLDEFEKEIKNLIKIKNDLQNLTGGIYSSCRIPLKKKHTIERTLNAIKDRLSYSKKYKKLCEEFEDNSYFINSEKLSFLFDEIDECIEFFNQHFDYLEAEHYRKQYENLRLNGCKIIRSVISASIEQCEMYVQNKIKNINFISFETKSDFHENNENQKHLKIKNLQHEKHNAFQNIPQIDSSLYHTQFRACGENVKPYTILLHKRTIFDSNEIYQQSLDQIEGIFAASRIRLIGKPLKDYVHNVLVIHTSVSSAVRHITTIILSFGQMELSVFFSFFFCQDPIMKQSKQF